jgi:UDP-N-acetylmuramoyl-L-alanyl-D-glutamate--2,6-diaminopimelate ligase
MKKGVIEKLCNTQIAKDIDIKSLTYDSRNVQENAMFFAVKGHKIDGNRFVDNLLKKYRDVYVVSEDSYTDDRCIKVDDVRDCMGKIASIFYLEPSKKLDVVGITGTNGKTTTTYLLHSIFKDSEIVGTTGYTIKNKRYKLDNTTPESTDIQNILHKMLENGAKKCFMEVSSHAITLKRISGIHFRLKVFTNISQDHLDYYSTMDNYAAAKLDFFVPDDKKIVNLDDIYAEQIIDKNTVTYGFNDKADIYPIDYKSTIDGIKLTLNAFGESINITSSLIGKYNIYNIMCAVAVALQFDINHNNIAEGIANCKNVPGRLEFYEKNGVYAVVDYAHTDDAMKNVLTTLSEIKKGRLIVVFGAGGDRDSTKRPKMGAVADSYADIVIVTSDNPRSENPEAIIKDIMSGINRDENIFVEVDRRKAIIDALDMAKPNDIVAIVGKGHEDYQILSDRVIHFDDREVIREHWQI